MATYTAIAAGGNFSNPATWGGTGVQYPHAGDTAIVNATMTGTVTVDAASACEVLNLTANGGTFDFSSNTLTVGASGTGSVILGGALSATTGTLAISNTTTITSNAITLPCKLQSLTTASKTITLKGNLTLTGLCTITVVTVINATGVGDGDELTLNGGISLAAILTGTTKLIIGGTGGTWTGTSTAYIGNNLDINCTTCTFAASVSYALGTMTYVAGTVTTGTNFYIRGGCTLNVASITFQSFLINASAAITLMGNLTSGVLYIGPSIIVSFTGAYDITSNRLRIAYGSTLSIPANKTVTIATTLYMSSLYSYSTELNSSTPLTQANLIYLGVPNSCTVCGMIFTDINASGSAQGIDNWNGGTLTNTTNIINRTSADFSNIFGMVG
jgi:hypothetical protein